MVLISIIIIAMFIVLIAWSWNSLGTLENKTKIIYITVGIFIAYIFTLIIFKISKIGINYPNIENMKLVQNVFVMLFTAINGYITLPFIFKKIDQIENDEIEKEKVKLGSNEVEQLKWII